VYPHIADLMTRVGALQEAHPLIKRWGISTNGIAFLRDAKYALLAGSTLDNICVGIDSLLPGERSKPSSPIGPTGREVFDGFIARLARDWVGREIKANVVFTGNAQRVHSVVREALAIGINVSVIEVNTVLETRPDVRSAFLTLVGDLASTYNLVPRLYEPLNEIYLYDSSGATVIKTYQDHCADRDCANCAKVHFRVLEQRGEWESVPCFLQTRRTIRLTNDGIIDPERVGDAIRYNGGGPTWEVGTEYDQ
jgi:hypothetical protein